MSKPGGSGRFKLRWFRHVSGCRLGKVKCCIGRRPRGRHRTHDRNYISLLAWGDLISSVPLDELEEVDRETETEATGNG